MHADRTEQKQNTDELTEKLQMLLNYYTNRLQRNYTETTAEHGSN